MSYTRVVPRTGLFDEQAALLSKDVDVCTSKLKHDVLVRNILTALVNSVRAARDVIEPTVTLQELYCCPTSAGLLQTAFSRAKMEVDEYYTRVFHEIKAEHRERCEGLQSEIDQMTELIESYVQVSWLCAESIPLCLGMPTCFVKPPLRVCPHSLQR